MLFVSSYFVLFFWKMTRIKNGAKIFQDNGRKTLVSVIFSFLVSVVFSFLTKAVATTMSLASAASLIWSGLPGNSPAVYHSVGRLLQADQVSHQLWLLIQSACPTLGECQYSLSEKKKILLPPVRIIATWLRKHRAAVNLKVLWWLSTSSWL